MLAARARERADVRSFLDWLIFHDSQRPSLHLKTQRRENATEMSGVNKTTLAGKLLGESCAGFTQSSSKLVSQPGDQGGGETGESPLAQGSGAGRIASSQEYRAAPHT